MCEGSNKNREITEPALKLSVDYRCVNYNVWRYWTMVHGGGPPITRVEMDIYSFEGMGMQQACIKIQSLIRKFLSRVRYTRKLLLAAEKMSGTLDALFEDYLQEMEGAALTRVEKSKAKRLVCFVHGSSCWSFNILPLSAPILTQDALCYHHHAPE